MCLRADSITSMPSHLAISEGGRHDLSCSLVTGQVKGDPARAAHEQTSGQSVHGDSMNVEKGDAGNGASGC